MVLLFLVLRLLLFYFSNYYFCYYYYYSLNLFLCFEAMLGNFLLSYLADLLFMFVTRLPVYITFYYCFALDASCLPVNSLTYKIFL